MIFSDGIQVSSYGKGPQWTIVDACKNQFFVCSVCSANWGGRGRKKERNSLATEYQIGLGIYVKVRPDGIVYYIGLGKGWTKAGRLRPEKRRFYDTAGNSPAKLKIPSQYPLTHKDARVGIVITENQ